MTHEVMLSLRGHGGAEANSIDASLDLPGLDGPIRLPLPKIGRLAQLVRARASHARGRGFKSLIAHGSQDSVPLSLS